jgi:hypothetical protein
MTLREFEHLGRIVDFVITGVHYGEILIML